MTIPSVLLVTGAYFPEISSAGLQARGVASALADRVRFTVLTTAVDRTLPALETVEGVPVHRLRIDVRRISSRAAAGASLIATFLRLQRSIDLVHVHGFSDKNVPLTALARWFGKPLILHLHTAGQDDPDAVRARGPVAFSAYRAADLFLSVSPHLSDAFRQAGLASDSLIDAPNGVDLTRFRPADGRERTALRRELGLPEDVAIVLFVGFFSRDKRPDVLCDAWLRAARRVNRPVALVCVGATGAPYFEIDPALARTMRERAEAAGLGDRLRFVDPTNAIDRYFRSADVFALPSAREAMPMALVEAMACALPCVATRLPRATDVIIDDQVSGVLVDDVEGLAAALESLIVDRTRAARIGARARQSIAERFSVESTAASWLDAYRRVLRAA